MTYAMVGCAACFATGITLVSNGSISGTVIWAIMACTLSLSLVLRKAPRWVRLTGLLLSVLALGCLRGSVVHDFPDWLIRRAPSIREVTGTVISYPDIGEASVSFALASIDMPGHLLVYWPCSEPLGRVHYGDVVRVNGSAQLPEVFDGFDYPAYLARQNVFATMFADTVQPSGSASRSLWHWGDILRQQLLLRYRAIMSPQLAAMAQSLMLGDRSALPTDIEEAFSRTGLMHLLAVSGLHLGIFLGVAWWGLRRMGLRPLVSYPLVGVLVLLALVVVGPRVSLVRAGLLFTFLALGSVLADCGLILRRWIHPLNGLAAAAIAILLIRPGALYDAGFQLTMAATGSILIAFSPSGWATRLSQSLQMDGVWRVWQWLTRLLIVSAAAQAGAAPVIAWHFEAFHPLSILVNLAAIPLAALSLWAGLFSILFVATRAFGAAVMPFALLLRGLEGLVSCLARISIVEWTVISTLGIWLGGCVAFVYLAHYSVWLSSRISNSTSMGSEPPED